MSIGAWELPEQGRTRDGSNVGECDDHTSLVLEFSGGYGQQDLVCCANDTSWDSYEHGFSNGIAKSGNNDGGEGVDSTYVGQ